MKLAYNPTRHRTVSRMERDPNSPLLRTIRATTATVNDSRNHINRPSIRPQIQRIPLRFLHLRRRL